MLYLLGWICVSSQTPFSSPVDVCTDSYPFLWGVYSGETRLKPAKQACLYFYCTVALHVCKAFSSYSTKDAREGALIQSRPVSTT